MAKLLARETETWSESFLPFDLEFTVSASVLLNLANSTFQERVRDYDFRRATYAILEEMAKSGNRVAAVQRTELRRMESMFEKLQRREDEIDRKSRPTCGDGLITNTSNPEVTCLDLLPSITDCVSLASCDSITVFTEPLLGPPAMETFYPDIYCEDFGLSSYNLLTVANQIGNDNDFILGCVPNDWIWNTM